ncbi:DNA polymerase III subunit delta' [Chelatococcus sambhunathii]|uniref:DNA polymerase III subunit delta n=1 Tax=Chelatococcus sambhunathii TaxID=363953 RepID=A0ABU1DFQ2_9HYPH|nr:DNA polymerase III subunit delta' [Chelatococcus sambhunathii]MDR4306963.1 DNA polymerase III subunit delta' [Chelatococcus sambhunathii]
MIEPDGLPEADRRDGCPHPRETARLVGHAEPERALLSAFRSGRMHHAWLLTGPEGIGKATLAYRMARFAFAHPNPAAAGAAAGLAVGEDDPAFRRVARLAHPDLLVLRRGWNADRKTHYGEIRVDDVRRATSFFGSTTGEGGWRVAIVDAADDLNGAAANALLKSLEEPPARTIFFLVAATPRALPAPVRSRCRTLPLRSLAAAEVAEILSGLPEIVEAHDAEEIAGAAELSDGTVARALSLLRSDGASLRRTVATLLDRLPAVDVKASHALAEDLARKGAEERFALFVGLVGDWLHDRVRAGASTGEPGLQRFAEAWDKATRAAREVETFNLDRRPYVLETLTDLSGLARG